MRVRRENLAIALAKTINYQRGVEKGLKFTSDSIFTAGLVEVLNAICEHKPIELVGDIRFDTHEFLKTSRKPL